MDILFLLLGIGMAVYGAHCLVDGGSAIAKRFNIPPLIIGSTIVAFGTSMPEFTVNINSAINGNTDLAFGNVMGSNLFNICAILGIVGMVTPIAVSRDAVSKDLPMRVPWLLKDRRKHKRPDDTIVTLAQIVRTGFFRGAVPPMMGYEIPQFQGVIF
jgi:Ca2+/Na+ antiporter